MKWFILVSGLAALLPVAPARAQSVAPNEAGVSMGHVHLFVQDVEATRKFLIVLGATPVKLGPSEALKFPGTLILINKGEPSGGTAGSVVNHIAFAVPNVQEAMEKWKAAGLKTAPGRIAQQGFVFTPDDLTRIEILEDKSLSVPIAMHHVHFFVADSGGSSSVPEIQSWYVKVFGAKPGKRDQTGSLVKYPPAANSDVSLLDVADVPGVSLIFRRSDTPTVPTKGRMLDHIAFEIKDLEGFCKRAEANGVKFDVPFTKRPDLNISKAFLTDPWGTYIELTERFYSF
jgi:catechol 2,3-dioxygenase-like lactoylglutathione lyase family enzyme